MIEVKSDPLNWYVLYVASRCEHKVGQWLRAIGYENFVPVQKQFKNWSDRKKLVEVVLFPNYVFVRAHAKHLQAPLEVPHAIKYVKFGNDFATLSSKEIELIKKMTGHPHPIEIRSAQLLPGEEVEIVSGPLRYQRGHILSINGSTQIHLAIPGLKCFARVVILKEELRKVGLD